MLAVLLPYGAWGDDFARVRRDAAELKTVQARFVQKKQMKILAKPRVAEGRFFYAAPDSFRWEYLKPLKAIIISSRGETRRYIMSGGNMIEDKSGSVQAMRLVLSEIANWMSGRFDRNPSFKAVFKEGKDTLITLIPVEGNMAGMIARIEISVAGKSMAVKSVRIIESEDSLTMIDFSNVELNKSINESLFQDVE